MDKIKISICIGTEQKYEETIQPTSPKSLSADGKTVKDEIYLEVIKFFKEQRKVKRAFRSVTIFFDTDRSWNGEKLHLFVDIPIKKAEAIVEDIRQIVDWRLRPNKQAQDAIFRQIYVPVSFRGKIKNGAGVSPIHKALFPEKSQN